MPKWMKQIEGCRVIDLMRDDRDMVKGVGVARLFREDLEESLLGLGQLPALWRRTARSKASKDLPAGGSQARH